MSSGGMYSLGVEKKKRRFAHSFCFSEQLELFEARGHARDVCSCVANRSLDCQPSLRARYSEGSVTGA